MRRPINVYLDTQDYINLGKDVLPSQDAAVKEYLLLQLKNGSVVIGCSYPLVFELLRNSDEKHLKDRQNRARTINEFCRGHAHPYPTDLSNGRKFPNDGKWVPMTAVEQITPSFIKAKFEEPINKILLDPRLSRQQRKQMKSNKGRKELLRSLRIGPFSKADFPTVPVPENILKGRLIERYLRGEVSAISVVNALTRWMTDPENLMELWYEYQGLTNPLEDIVAKTAAPLFEALKQIREIQKKNKILIASHKRNKRELRKLIVGAGMDPATPEFADLLADPDDLNFSFAKKKIDELFGVGRGDVIEEYVDSFVTSDQNPEDSDLVDMLHFLYIPDVDLFRCDRKMAHLVGKSHTTFQNKIVSSLLDLPRRIETLKATRLTN